MAIRVYIKTYNYHELNANYHKLILFRYLQIRFMFLLLPRAPARQKILSQILNKIYVPFYPRASARQKIFPQILNKIYVPLYPPRHQLAKRFSPRFYIRFMFLLPSAPAGAPTPWPKIRFMFLLLPRNHFFRPQMQFFLKNICYFKKYIYLCTRKLSSGVGGHGLLHRWKETFGHS